MSRIVIGHGEAREKLTARLFWKPITETGYIDAGNVLDYTDATSRSLVTRVEANKGERHVTTEVVNVNHEAYSFSLDERVREQERLIKLARKLADAIQTAGEGTTATISDITKGRWYDIGVFKIANVTVNASGSGLLIDGDDYELDAVNGRIHILDDGDVSNGEDLVLRFDNPRIIFERIQSRKQSLFQCDVIIEEVSQHNKMWLRRGNFRANINVTDFPVQSGPFGVYRAKVTAQEPVTWRKRPEAQSLGEIEDAVAGESSSESSQSSSSPSDALSTGPTSQSFGYTDTSSASSGSSSSQSSSLSSNSSSSSPSSTSQSSLAQPSSQEFSSFSQSSSSSTLSSLSSLSSSSLSSNSSSSSSSVGETVPTFGGVDYEPDNCLDQEIFTPEWQATGTTGAANLRNIADPSGNPDMNPNTDLDLQLVRDWYDAVLEKFEASGIEYESLEVYWVYAPLSQAWAASGVLDDPPSFTSLLNGTLWHVLVAYCPPTSSLTTPSSQSSSTVASETSSESSQG